METSKAQLDENRRKNLNELMPVIVSLVLFLILYVLDHFEPGWSAMAKCRGVAYAVAFLPVGLPVVINAVKEICKGEIFNEYFLMTLAAVGAFYIGEYPEAVAVMLFYSVGEFFQERAVGKAQRDIRALVELSPKKVVVLKGAERIECSPENVLPEEIVEVPAGGRVPLDGILLDSPAHFDTSALTGESMPRLIEKDGAVQAGMMTLSSCIRLRVTKIYAESAISRIMEMVRNAASRKAPAELFIRRFARVYTPIVILLAVIIALLPPLLLGFDTYFNMYLNRALVFLVVSCPCALVISIPLGYFSGIGIASKRGILFKGGNYLDAVTKLNVVMFDKTGTLTKGQFEVGSVCTEAGISSIELLKIVAAVESHSTHPLAKAIVRKALEEGLELKSVETMEEIGGFGVKAQVEGQSVLVGNERFMTAEKVKGDNTGGETGSTAVFCAVDGQLWGYILLSDVLKDDAKRAVMDLKQLGMERVGILSGDKTSIVARLAGQLGVDEYQGDLMPEGKVEYIRKMLQGNHVAFVGDGINDAPVLALSNVGIAMGGAGSDAAVETADIVVQGDCPSKVAEALKIGQVTHRVVKSNILLAISVKLLVLALGALGLVGLWWAVFADTGVALLCVINVFTIQKLYTSLSLKKSSEQS
jgi:Cd2+/Zn2+-exporting ATPase